MTNCKTTKTVFIFSAICCTVLRVLLKLNAVDPSTGFYEGGGILVPVFNFLLGVSAVALLALGLLWRPAAPSGGGAPRVLTAVLGAATLAYSAYEILSLMNTMDISSALLPLLFQFVGAASGFSFLWIAFTQRGISSHAAAYAMLLPLVWQVYTLLSLFMKYTIIRSASDQLLNVLMLVFLAPFLLAHGRLLGGINPEKGRRHQLAFGLPFALFAVTASCGTIVATLGGRSVDIALGMPAAIYYLVFAAYAVSCVFSTRDR